MLFFSSISHLVYLLIVLVRMSHNDILNLRTAEGICNNMDSVGF